MDRNRINLKKDICLINKETDLGDYDIQSYADPYTFTCLNQLIIYFRCVTPF